MWGRKRIVRVSRGDVSYLYLVRGNRLDVIVSFIHPDDQGDDLDSPSRCESLCGFVVSG